MTNWVTRTRGMLTRNNEKVLLGVYFVIMLAFALPLSQMLQNGWKEGNVVRALFGIRRYVGVSMSEVSVFFFGLFTGFLLLMLVDRKKRVQGVLLLAAALVGSITLAQANFLIDNIGAATVPSILGGVLAGLVLGGGRKFLNWDTVNKMEFRRATKGLYYVLLIVIVFAFLERHIQYPHVFRVTADGVTLRDTYELTFGVATDGLMSNLLVSGVFVVTLRQFVQYDAEKTFFVLGPPGSGKSMFMVSCYLAARDKLGKGGDSAPLEPTEELMSMVGGLDDNARTWPVDATSAETEAELALTYAQGSVFPKNLRLESVDYAGEQLRRLPDAIEDLGTSREEEHGMTTRRLAERVQAADTLVFAIDVERFKNGDSMDASEYFSILQQTSAVKTMVVATKADLLADDFREQEKLEFHRDYEQFKEFVNRELQTNEQVKALMTESTARTIYPVGVQTTENENGEVVPMVSDRGSLETHGYKEFLEAMD